MACQLYRRIFNCAEGFYSRINRWVSQFRRNAIRRSVGRPFGDIYRRICLIHLEGFECVRVLDPDIDFPSERLSWGSATKNRMKHKGVATCLLVGIVLAFLPVMIQAQPSV